MDILNQVVERICNDSPVKKELLPFVDAYQKLYEGKFTNNFAIVYCVQNFEELFLSFGIRRYRLCGGDYLLGNQVKNQLPLLTCPLVRSSLGYIQKHPRVFRDSKLILVPTTCDWKVKLCDHLDKYEQLQIMELPHVHNQEKSQRRWISETKELVNRLEQVTGKSLSLQKLKKGISSVLAALSIAGKLEKVRLQSDKNSSLIFPFVLNAYGIMDIEVWIEKVETLLAKLGDTVKNQTNCSKIFLCGAPCMMPNYKLPWIIQSAGGILVGDELCTSSRQFWDIPVIDESNKENILKAIANRYYHPCVCPTFTPNHNRMLRILTNFKTSLADGIIYHTLKGCHPYDMERFAFEDTCKKHQIPFLAVETDDTLSDELSLTNRIEAFVDSLDERRG